jgi:hypothetical protein
MIFKSRGDLVVEHIANRNLLPLQRESLKWAGTDSQELYLKNLETQSKNWHYRNKSVRYNLNSKNYRTAEFEKIDWSNSIVIFGCSNIFGVGVDEEETVSYFLSKLTNRPVINLGVGSSSMTFAFHNSVILAEGFPTPWAVIHVWTEISRCVCYATQGPVHHGSWNIENEEYMKQWTLQKHNPITNGMMISLASKAIWQNKTKFIEASYFTETAKAVNCTLLDPIDHARDLCHPGPKTNESTARILSELLLKCK